MRKLGICYIINKNCRHNYYYVVMWYLIYFISIIFHYEIQFIILIFIILCYIYYNYVYLSNYRTLDVGLMPGSLLNADLA